MSSSFSHLTRLLLLAACCAFLHGQTPDFGFAYRSEANPSLTAVTANGTILFPAVAAGGQSIVTLVATNRGSASWAIGGGAVGGNGFSLSGSGANVLPPGGTALFTLVFAPLAPGPASGTFSLQLTSGLAFSPVNFFLSGSGIAPDLVTSYILNPGGNQTPVRDNETLRFPATEVGQTASATFVVTNRGTGPGPVRQVSVTGEAFALSGLPLLPAEIAPDRDLRFTVSFAPKSRDRVTGALRVDLGGAVRTILLEGEGKGAALSYDATADGRTFTLASGGATTLAETPLGGRTAVTIRIRNTGNADARVSAISVTGTGFQLTDVGPLPVTLTPGAATAFTVTFAPTEAGPSTGRLRIDGASFDIVGTGLGSRLRLTALIGSASIPLQANGTMNFPNTMVGARNAATIRVANSGNTAFTVNSISLTGGAFSVVDAPALPLQLAPEQSVDVPLVFAPDSLGSSTGVVQIEDQVINLRGIGTSPPPLPSVNFAGVGSSADALQQPPIGLSLASPYPMDLTGTLTIGFTSESFVDDPVIQFATGGRTVAFRIPANSTDAIFGQGARQIQFQTGTVAGTINVSGAFKTGAVDLTPTPPPGKTVVVPVGEPKIRSVQIGSRSATGFELLITGYSTSRSVSQIMLQFAPAPGHSLQTTSLPLNVEAPFSAWYQNSSSYAVGSQFTVSVGITVQGDVNSVQSVTVTATNQRGTSAPVTVNLR